MKLVTNDDNCVTVYTKKMDVLFSFTTPVAIRDNKTGLTYVTDAKFSRTTSKHINQFGFGGAEPLAHEKLVSKVTKL